MELLVLGASGGVGQSVVAQALARGHRVRAPIRPSAALGDLPEQHPALVVTRGDPLDAERLEQAARGTDAVLSCLGMRRRVTANPWSAITAPHDFNSASASRIIAAMKSASVERVIAISAAGVAESATRMNLVMRLLVASSSIGVAYRDLAVMEQRYAESGLDWCCVRPVTLTSGPYTGRVRLVDHFGATMTVSRADVAGFMLDWVERKGAQESRTPQIAGG